MEAYTTLVYFRNMSLIQLLLLGIKGELRELAIYWILLKLKSQRESSPLIQVSIKEKESLYAPQVLGLTTSIYF